MILGPTPSLARVSRFFAPLNYLALDGFIGRPNILLSQDGRRWFDIPFPAPSEASYTSGGATFLDNAFWVFCAKGFLRTENGTKWDYIPQETGGKYITGLVELGTNFLAVGGDNSPRIWVGEQVGSLEPVADTGAGRGSLLVASSGSVAAMLFPDRTIRSTTNGTTLTARTSNLGSSGSQNFIKYFPSLTRFIAGLSDGKISTSDAAAATWTARTSGVSNARDIAGGDGKYVLGGSGGALRRSADLLTWASVASKPAAFTSLVESVTYRQGRHIVAAINGQMVESEDGDHFTLLEGYPASACYALTARPD
jgi:hypothetical protein